MSEGGAAKPKMWSPWEDPIFCKMYRLYNNESYAKRLVDEQIMWSIVSSIREANRDIGGKITHIDLGSGTGELQIAIENTLEDNIPYQSVGVDISAGMAGATVAGNLISWTESDKSQVYISDTLEFLEQQPTGSVHVISAVNHLYHFNSASQRRIMKEIGRVLTPNGAIAFVEPHIRKDATGIMRQELVLRLTHDSICEVGRTREIKKTLLAKVGQIAASPRTIARRTMNVVKLVQTARTLEKAGFIEKQRLLESEMTPIYIGVREKWLEESGLPSAEHMLVYGGQAVLTTAKKTLEI